MLKHTSNKIEICLHSKFHKLSNAMINRSPFIHPIFVFFPFSPPLVAWLSTIVESKILYSVRDSRAFKIDFGLENYFFRMPKKSRTIIKFRTANYRLQVENDKWINILYNERFLLRTKNCRQISFYVKMQCFIKYR